MNEIRPHRKRRGTMYIALLFLMLTLTALGMAFLHRESIAALAHHESADYERAGYLAQAGVNHAMWLVVNNCAYPPAVQTAYTMHALGGGQYGYKVKRHGDGRQVTVASIGHYGNAEVEQSYVLQLVNNYIPSMFMYYATGTNTPSAVTDYCGGVTTPTLTFNTGNSQQLYIKAAAAPARREVVMAALDSSDDINVAVWNGSSWGNQLQISTNADMNHETVGVAYETLSGHALVLGKNGAKTMCYNMWNGSYWQYDLILLGFSATAFTENSLTQIGNFVMRPAPNSNEILIPVLYNNLVLYRWNGSSFSRINGPSGTALETSPTDKDYMCFDCAYQQQSGTAMIVWGKSGSPQCQYATWNGSALSAIGALPSFGSEADFVRLAPEPGGNRILCVASTDDQRLWAALWNGSAWTDVLQLDSDLRFNDGLNFNVAWFKDASKALIVWSSNNGDHKQPVYFSWTSGTPLVQGTTQRAPELDDAAHQVRMQSDRGANRIWVMLGLASKRLQVMEWTGGTLVAPNNGALTSNLPTDSSRPFDLVYEGNKS